MTSLRRASTPWGCAEYGSNCFSLSFLLFSYEVMLILDFIQSIAGIYSPISIALVSILLFFFRAIYSEVGTALPLNGILSDTRAR
jgi:hypothetical protein